MEGAGTFEFFWGEYFGTRGGYFGITGAGTFEFFWGEYFGTRVGYLGTTLESQYGGTWASTPPRDPFSSLH